MFEGNNSTPLTLDYLIIQNGTISSTTASSSLVATSTPGGVVSGTSATATVGSSTPVGAIVGGVIGGLALTVFVIVGFLFFHRRHKRAAQEKVLMSMPEPFDPTPVYPSSIAQNTSPSVVTSYSSPSQTTQMGLPVTKGQAYHASMRPSFTPTNLLRPVPFQQTSVPSSLPSRTTETLASAPVESNDIHLPSIVLHADSGIRMPSSTAGRSVMDVPPLYTLD